MKISSNQLKRMGFGDDRIRIVRIFKHKPCIATIGGKTDRYDSEAEFMWFCYQEFLKQNGEIRDWKRKIPKFDFWEFGYRNKPYEYTPDGIVIENDGSIIHQEYKGYAETSDITRIKRAFKHYDAIFDVIVKKKNKKGKQSEIIAKLETAGRCVRRVISASDIYSQVGKKIILGCCEKVEYV